MTRFHDRAILDGLPEATNRALLLLQSILEEAGYRCYLVGGSVRDILMGKKPEDFDIATDARPETVVRLFHKTIPTGIKHGTVTVLLKGHTFEVTTFRSEQGYSDGRHPDSVQYASTLEEDLQRRDFTINAISYDPLRKTLIDEHGGVADIEKKIIRTIGDPRERFFEDGLRPVRACRFTSTLGFDIEPATWDALRDPQIHSRVGLVSIERFTDELWKGLSVEHASRMIHSLELSGLAAIFIPELHDRTTPSALLETIDVHFPASPPMRIALWWGRQFATNGDDVRQIAKRLKFSNDASRDLVQTLSFLEFQEGFVSSGAIPAREEIRFFLSRLKGLYRENTLRFLEQLAEAKLIIHPEPWLEIFHADPLVVGDLRIGGDELLKLGFRGKQIGEVLNLLLERVLHDPACDQKRALEEILQTKSMPN